MEALRLITTLKPAERRGPHIETRFQRFLDQRGLPCARVEAQLRRRLNGRAPSRQQMMRWRLGRNEPRRKDMVRILWAVREAAQDPSIRMDDIFDFDAENPSIWRD